MFKRLRILLACLCLLNIFQGARAETIPETPVVKVGALLSLSGGLEQWCSYIRQGMELAQHDGLPVGMDLVVEDDHSLDKKQVVTSALKLLQANKVDLLYSWSASDARVLMPIAQTSRAPLLFGAYDHNIADQNSGAMGAFVNYELLPREIARFLVKQKRARKLGLIMADEDWSTSFEKPFREEVSSLGATIEYTETIRPDETDLRSLLLRLKNKNVEATLAPIYSNALYAFLKQAREVQYPGIIYVGDGMFEEDIKVAGKNAEGVYAAQIWLDSESFYNKFKKYFGSEASALQLGLVATGYDWVAHLSRAAGEILKEGGTINRDTIRKKLMTFKSTGVLGPQMYGEPPALSGEMTVVVSQGKYTLVPSAESHP